MMSSHKVLAAVTVLLSLVPPVQAQRKYVVYGSGTLSCGMWTAGVAGGDRRLALMGWVHGFLTGVGAATDTINIREVDQDAMEQWLNNYCSQNPLVTLNRAANDLVKALAQ